MKNTFTITYEAAAMNGESGYAYEIRCRGRVVRGGWSKGRKHHAEQQARADVNELMFERVA